MSPFSAEREVDERERLAEQQQRDIDLRSVLSTPAGRRFYWRLTDGQCEVMSGSFRGEDTHETAYYEGRRSVGRELIADAQRVASGGYLLMLQEAMSARRRTDEAAEE